MFRFGCLTLKDAQLIREWRNESEGNIYRTPYYITYDMQEKWYDVNINNRNSKARFWGVYEDVRVKDEDDFFDCTQTIFLGCVGIENIQWENSIGEISYMVMNNEYDNSKIFRGLLNKAFNSLGLRNVFSEVYTCSPELKFWRDMAMEYEAFETLLPDRKLYDGKYYDSFYINFNKKKFREFEGYDENFNSIE